MRTGKLWAAVLPGRPSSYPWDFTPVNGVLLFGAEDGGGYGPWSADGTVAGTRQVSSFAFCGFEYPC